jgi:hypothetical protein
MTSNKQHQITQYSQFTPVHTNTYTNHLQTLSLPKCVCVQPVVQLPEPHRIPLEIPAGPNHSMDVCSLHWTPRIQPPAAGHTYSVQHLLHPATRLQPLLPPLRQLGLAARLLKLPACRQRIRCRLGAPPVATPRGGVTCIVPARPCFMQPALSQGRVGGWWGVVKLCKAYNVHQHIACQQLHHMGLGPGKKYQRCAAGNHRTVARVHAVG